MRRPGRGVSTGRESTSEMRREHGGRNVGTGWGVGVVLASPDFLGSRSSPGSGFKQWKSWEQLLWKRKEMKGQCIYYKAASLVNWSTTLLMLKSPLRRGQQIAEIRVGPISCHLFTLVFASVWIFLIYTSYQPWFSQKSSNHYRYYMRFFYSVD